MGHYTRASKAVSRMNGKSGRKLEPLRRQLLNWTQNWMKRAKCHDSRTDPFTFRPFHFHMISTHQKCGTAKVRSATGWNTHLDWVQSGEGYGPKWSAPVASQAGLASLKSGLNGNNK